MLAYDYPLLGVFWTLVFLAFWVGVLFAVFRALIDIVRNPDMGGVAKALWVGLVVLVPFLGIVAYVVVRQHAISERAYHPNRP